MAEDKWTWSDKLAITLACVGAAMALIPFLVDKNPITVGVMVVCFGALLVHPILHLIPSRKFQVPALILMIILVAGFGWAVWPKKVEIAQTPSSHTVQSPVEMAQNPPTTTNQQKLGIKPKKHYSKVVSEPAESSTKEQGATPSASAQQPTFSVTNPSGSIVNQDSTVNAPQTVNNYGPTKLELDVERL